jgi:hypothetical protein
LIEALIKLDARREGLKICDGTPEKYPKNEDSASFKADFTATYFMASELANSRMRPHFICS